MSTAPMVIPKLYVWFEDRITEEGSPEYLCLEFHGGYQHDAHWYRPFWRRLRMELGAKDAESDTGWKQGDGGMAGKVWRMRLDNQEILRKPLTRQDAYEALQSTIRAFNTFPHDVGIVLEAI